MRKYLFIIVFLMQAITVHATEQDEKRSYISLTFENDSFFKEDGLYSNGLFFTWGYNHVEALNDEHLPTWISYLANKTYLTSSPDKQYTVSYGLGHIIQTSTDIKVAELMEEDAPYVGMLAWEVSLLSYDDVVSDEAGLILGVVGPIAGAEFVQTFVHDVIGANEPQGWDHQIGNEFVFRAQARRTWRLYETDFGSGFWNTEFDLLGGIDGGVGNLRSDLAGGVGVRFGQGLSKNFASSTVFPVQKFNGLSYSPYGWYIFANASASYVANDIFMDGNTFKDSHNVDLIHEQAAFSVGIMANIYNFSILYTLLRLSDEYEGQSEPSRHGSVSVTYHF